MHSLATAQEVLLLMAVIAFENTFKKLLKYCTCFHSCGVKKVASFLVGVECCNSLYGPSGHLQAVDCFTDDALIMWSNFHTSLYKDQEISILGIVISIKCSVK